VNRSLTAKQVQEIRSLRKDAGLTYPELAAQFKVSLSTVFNVVEFITYKEVGKPPKNKKRNFSPNRKLTAVQVQELRRLRNNTRITYPELAAQFQVSISTAFSAVEFATYKEIGENPRKNTVQGGTNAYRTNVSRTTYG
jgi:DNA-binding transcriptional regulator YiaG